MFQRFLTCFSVLVFVFTTMTSPALAQDMLPSAGTNAVASQNIHSDSGNSDCAHMDKAEMAKMAQSKMPAAPSNSDDCCKQKCDCKMAHCSTSVLSFGTAGFTSQIMKIVKAGLPKAQILASINLDPLKRPPRT